VKTLKKGISIAIGILSLIFVVVFLDGIVNFIINIQWFYEVKYISVYFTKVTATIKLMIPIFVVFFIAICLYYISLKRSIIRYRKVSDVNLKNKKKERVIFSVINFIISLSLAYIFVSSYWYRILQFNYSSNFNVRDPIFNKDISFYMFKLPLLQSLYNLFVSVLMIFIIVTLIIYFLMNVKVMKSDITKFAGKQLATVSALMLLSVSVGYLLKAYYLLYSSNGVVYGASYTDINVTLFFYRLIMIVSFISAIVVFVSILISKIKPIIISLAAIFLLFLIQGLATQLVQQFIVESNESSLEEKYIKNNIEYTRKAFNINNIEEQKYDISNNLSKEDINNNRNIIDNIKVNSYKPALDFYNQVQVIRYYYGFNDIDIDRYYINGKYNQVFVAAREINSDSLDPNTWQNKHLIYTHGYGVVMSKVNSVTAEGQPNFVIKDVPPDNSTDIFLKNSRIYFGEKTNYYAVVNTNREEFDYPKGGDNAVNKYDGEAGIKMSFINRVLFAINERNKNFLLSQDINSNSKILTNRNIVERVKKIAPFLSYDSDPYMVISEGKLYWILDAYTSSDKYPYSQPVNNINYIRNSVKVVISAFDGTTDFYIVDKEDPIIESYNNIFKGLFKDVSTLSPDIRSHFRYPEDMFNIQRNVLGKYHMTDPKVFLNGEDLWEEAKTQKKEEDNQDANEAAYVVMKLPNENSIEMILLEYFNARGKENMTAMFGARMDGDNYGKLILYKFPPNQTVYSPQLFQKKVSQDTTISKDLTLWEGSGSTIDYGGTVIVPINNSLLYVESMYLTAQGKNAIPEMKRVIVSYGEKVVFAESIDKALEQLFFKNDNKTQNNNIPSVDNKTLESVKKAKELYDKSVEAQKSGDWTKYGEYIKEVGDILNNIIKEP
jgi:uncharacterized membrane protein (UPF0182 family)